MLIGPDSQARVRLRPRPNIHVLGRRPYARLPAYLYNVDVGLIPFDVVREPALVHATHPLKLYEYLACELPVVATRWDELEQLGNPAVLYDGSRGLAPTLERALADAHDVAAGVAFAAAADRGGRVETLLHELDEIR